MKLWGGRFKKGLNELANDFNSSIPPIGAASTIIISSIYTKAIVQVSIKKMIALNRCFRSAVICSNKPPKVVFPIISGMGVSSGSSAMKSLKNVKFAKAINPFQISLKGAVRTFNKPRKKFFIILFYLLDFGFPIIYYCL